MTEKSMRAFYNDPETKENVYNYLIEFCKEEALKILFGDDHTSRVTNGIAIANAKDVIDKAFENLDNLFSPKPEKKENINEAR